LLHVFEKRLKVKTLCVNKAMNHGVEDVGVVGAGGEVEEHLDISY
jgi:hypothetical protein